LFTCFLSPHSKRIAEYNETTGALIREYVWLNGAPIAVVEGGVISFVRSDHIERPVFATNSTGVKVWTAAYLPFGGVRVTTGTPPTASGLRPFGPENSPLDCFPGAPHFRGSGSSRRTACTRTGCGIMIRRREGICRPTPWGWSMGRVCMGMRGRIPGGMWIHGESSV
jgi:hypothetical protein